MIQIKKKKQKKIQQKYHETVKYKVLNVQYLTKNLFH